MFDFIRQIDLDVLSSIDEHYNKSNPFWMRIGGNEKEIGDLIVSISARNWVLGTWILLHVGLSHRPNAQETIICNSVNPKMLPSNIIDTSKLSKCSSEASITSPDPNQLTQQNCFVELSRVGRCDHF